MFLVFGGLPPAQCWIKLNTDRAAKGALGLVGAGGIFRDHLGYSISFFAAPLGVKFAFEA